MSSTPPRDWSGYFASPPLVKAGAATCAVPRQQHTPTTPAMLVLRPGDKVLVTLTDDPRQQTLEDMAAGLRKSFPGVEFTIMTGVSGIAAAPPG